MGGGVKATAGISKRMRGLAAPIGQNREPTIGGALRRARHDALGHFALKHQNEPVEPRRPRLGFEPAGKKRGRDVVGQVGANARGAFATYKPGKISLQCIAFDDIEPPWIVIRDLRERREAAPVALDRNDFARAFGEQRPRESAGAWADLDNGRIGQRRGGARDAAGEIEIEKKILTEGFFCQEPMRGSDLAQRRKAVEQVSRDGSRPGFSHF